MDVELFLKNGKKVSGGYIHIISEFMLDEIVEIVEYPIPRKESHFKVKHLVPKWEHGVLRFYVIEAQISNDVVPGRASITPLVRFQVVAEEVDWKTNRCLQGNRNPKWEN